MPVEIFLHWCGTVHILISSSFVIYTLIFSFLSLFIVSFLIVSLLCFGFNKLMNSRILQIPVPTVRMYSQAVVQFGIPEYCCALMSWVAKYLYWIRDLYSALKLCSLFKLFFFFEDCFPGKKKIQVQIHIAFSSVSVVNPMKTFLHMSYKNPHRNLIALLGWDVWCI